jgi:hypothetical protein
VELHVVPSSSSPRDKNWYSALERGLAIHHDRSSADLLVSKFTGGKEMSTLQDAETVGDGYRVKVLDAERLDVFILMIYRHLE